MNAQISTAGIYKPQAFSVIVWGGLIAGVLDAADGIVAYGIRGLNPMQVLQYIASGALGAAAFTGGLLAAGAGALFHFFIAFGPGTRRNARQWPYAAVESRSSCLGDYPQRSRRKLN